MELCDLEYLIASADTGNFGRAAESFGLSVSTISRRIGRLENELGLSLFERRHSGVCLTAGGKSVMVHARRALAELDTVRRSGLQNGAGDVGEIRLGVRSPPIGKALVGLLSRWRAAHANLALTISEMSDRELAIGLDERRLDLALTSRHAVWPHAVTLPLFRERLLAALPFGHVLAERRVDWTALRKETILVQGSDETQAGHEFHLSALVREAKIRMCPASKQSLFALVAAGFGITLATASQAEITFPGIVFRPIESEDASVEMVLAWLPELEDPAVGRFVAFLRDELRSRRNSP